ncbi:glycoside hydrolase family 99-like domain-containing protein [Xanthomonas campestris]|uniref:glycoside hydrolase family 99-like domain-containing protein n=1 Tax=Xanthomonas campestris TaxID=339 RepID=UPI0008A24DF5|nr:glycoside hydrolase family 99-like domain-containing protein [Xanthomonas campestris]MEB1150381.1 glycoside hydrolase family 99-like domain-containing protein [Xanthomonas campestris pv. campestris]MCC5095553.1 glycoside hydrolase family 99-like domain-containing protein [Xanthomonas campestris]MEA9582702.1 glycoside hydrolase family 99-like domain-containing protein [Xanthomonas campestris]MEA9592149.1 glycoside hydrolase family 99-like domain-containing protein [Xanthomonas campestris]MEA
MSTLDRSIQARARAHLFGLLRAGFRVIPLSDATRDRWRSWFLDRHADWVPEPVRGRANHAISRRPTARSDEAAIGHVAYRTTALPETLPATLVAFYLPQFHPIPENDAWWGKGFTEWRNVSRTLPQFEGHQQPRLPADLGFYDLRTPDVMREQARLAQEYGLGAFCFYFYWFAGKTLLEMPITQWHADTSITLPFCLCWANEKWARRWDGRGHDVLIDQAHSADDDLAFIAHVARYMRNPKYLRVGDRPLLLVYRPHLLPEPVQTAARWRNWCRDNGIGEIHLAYVQGFERPDPRDIGFDAAVEFPPNMNTPPSVTARQRLVNPDFSGDVLDWRELARDMEQRPLRDYTLYPGVNPGWDNEPRRSGKGRIYLHASPRRYRDWLARTVQHRLANAPSAHRMVFINAWNEWAEGAVLEPDARLGYAWLDATRQALTRAPDVATEICSPSACVVLHAWYLDVLDEMLDAIVECGTPLRIIITTDLTKVIEVTKCIQRRGIQAEVEGFENRGRDILPFLHVANRLLDENVQLVLKLHTKKSTHRDDGNAWRGEMLTALLGPQRVDAIVNAFSTDPLVGLAAPEDHLLPVTEFIGGNADALDYLTVRTGSDAPDTNSLFASGSMFWARLEALRPLLDAHIHASEFESEQGQIDGTLAHAIERFVGLAVTHSGHRVTTVEQTLGITKTPSAQPYRYARKAP